MSDIFISYASQDLSRVKPIIEALEARSWSVWWDRSIRPGEIWDELIGSEISTARCVVVLWSHNSIESSWVRSEAHEARARKILVPALLDKIRIPVGLNVVQAANLVNWDGHTANDEFDKLTSAISEVLSRTPASPCPTPTTARNQTEKMLDTAVRIRTRKLVLGLGILPLILAFFFSWYVASVKPITRGAAILGLKRIEQGKYSTDENERLGDAIRNSRTVKLLMPNASSFSQTFRNDLEEFFSHPDASMQVILATPSSEFYKEMMPMTFDKTWEEQETASTSNTGLIALSRKRLLETAKDERKVEFRYFNTQFRLPLIIIDDRYCYLTLRLPPSEGEQSPRFEFDAQYATFCTRHFNRLWQLSHQEDKTTNKGQ